MRRFEETYETVPLSPHSLLMFCGCGSHYVTQKLNERRGQNRSMVPRLLLIIIIAVFIAVGGVFAYQFGAGQYRETAIQFETVAWGSGFSSIPQSQRVVINNQSEWTTLWRQAFCPNSNTCSDPPTVNFTASTVIAVFFGFAPSNGYKTNVTQVMEIGSTVHVSVIDAEPRNCGEPQIILYPFHIIRIPKNQSPVVFEERVSYFDC